MVRSTLQRLAISLTLAVLAFAQTPAFAQVDAPIDQRVNRLEKEMRAVQRSVYPGGAVQPELGGSTTPAVAAGNPATAPVADLTARIDSLERQLTTITGANEQVGYRVRQLEESVARLQSRLSAVEAGPAAGSAGAAAPVATEPAVRREEIVEPARTTTRQPVRPGVRPAATSVSVGEQSATRPDAARRSAIAAIEVPATGDAVEDDYTYAFRLYTAKLYPEAQTRLKAFTANHPPSNKRWSYAQNLLGRAYFDEGKPALASVALYENYQKAPRGERAAESLYWLGRALTRLNKLPDACKVYDELSEVYGAKLTSDARARAAKGRDDAKCTG